MVPPGVRGIAEDVCDWAALLVRLGDALTAHPSQFARLFLDLETGVSAFEPGANAFDDFFPAAKSTEAAVAFKIIIVRIT